MERGILVQRSMGPRLIIVGSVDADDPAQVRFTEHDDVVQALPAPRQPDEQQTIGVVEGRSLWRPAPEHVDLLAKNQDLRFTPRAGLEQSNERTTKQSEQLDHRATASPDSHRFASYMEFPTGTAARIFEWRFSLLLALISIDQESISRIFSCTFFQPTQTLSNRHPIADFANSGCTSQPVLGGLHHQYCRI